MDRYDWMTRAAALSWLVLTACVMPNASIAQEAVTSGMAQSGRRITAGELAQLVPGSTVRYRAASGAARSFTYELDGTIGGLLSDLANRVGPRRGAVGTAVGAYKIDLVKQQLCHALRWPVDYYRSVEDRYCHNMFIFEGRIFGVSDTNASLSLALVPEYLFPPEAIARSLRPVTADYPR